MFLWMNEIPLHSFNTRGNTQSETRGVPPPVKSRDKWPWIEIGRDRLSPPRARGVNRPPSKRSFVRFVSERRLSSTPERVPVGFVSSETIYERRVRESRPCESTGSRGALCSSALSCAVPSQASFIAFTFSPFLASSPTRPVQIIEPDTRRNWIDFWQSSHDPPRVHHRYTRRRCLRIWGQRFAYFFTSASLTISLAERVAFIFLMSEIFNSSYLMMMNMDSRNVKEN